MKLNRKLNMGMIGGGPGAFIGEVHRRASRLDGEIELVAGAFDIDPKKSKKMGRELALNKKRVYSDYKEMIKAELALPEGERIDFVAVTTPNNWHFPIARDFLKAGFHVMCEKPMTITSAQAKELAQLVKKKKRVFGLMHNYTGYPMVKCAKDMVRLKKIGKVRKVVVQYPQTGLACHCVGEDWTDAGELAYRSQAERCRRLRWGYWHTRGQSGGVHHGSANYGYLR